MAQRTAPLSIPGAKDQIISEPGASKMPDQKGVFGFIRGHIEEVRNTLLAHMSVPTKEGLYSDHGSHTHNSSIPGVDRRNFLRTALNAFIGTAIVKQAVAQWISPETVSADTGGEGRNEVQQELFVMKADPILMSSTDDFSSVDFVVECTGDRSKGYPVDIEYEFNDPGIKQPVRFISTGQVKPGSNKITTNFNTEEVSKLKSAGVTSVNISLFRKGKSKVEASVEVPISFDLKQIFSPPECEIDRNPLIYWFSFSASGGVAPYSFEFEVESENVEGFEKGDRLATYDNISIGHTRAIAFPDKGTYRIRQRLRDATGATIVSEQVVEIRPEAGYFVYVEKDVVSIVPIILSFLQPLPDIAGRNAREDPSVATITYNFEEGSDPIVIPARSGQVVSHQYNLEGNTPGTIIEKKILATLRAFNYEQEVLIKAKLTAP